MIPPPPIKTELSSSLHWLALTRIERLGSVRARHLVERFGGPQEVFAASRGDLQSVPHLGHQIAERIQEGPDLAWAHDQLRRAHSLGASVICYDNPEYPDPLRRIPSPPPVLFVQGDLPLFHERAVAVVGTRNPTTSGLSTCHRFASDWGQQGIRIVSGLALGIDSQAHRSTLSVGGQTVAVLGCPLDAMGSGSRAALAQEIARRGALVSEIPFGAAVQPPNFVRRNRIISGLSDAVVVVEAPRGSGALITARQALEQDRELLACPGPAGEPTFEGCFDLLRQGAHLCAAPSDLLDAVGWAPESPRQPGSDHPVAKLLRRGDLTAEELSLRLSTPVQTLLSEIVLLELSGVVRRAPGGRFTIRP